jgi:hypothetical protein
MRVNDTKLEKMQNMINFVQITIRDKGNEKNESGDKKRPISSGIVNMSSNQKQWR